MRPMIPVDIPPVLHVADDVPPAALHDPARQVSLHAHHLYVHPGPGEGPQHLALQVTMVS